MSYKDIAVPRMYFTDEFKPARATNLVGQLLVLRDCPPSRCHA